MARLTRHEILKEDHFLLAIDKIREFYFKRHKELLIGVGIFVLVLVAFFGARYYWGTEEEKSKDALSQALRIYHAPVAGTPEAANAELTFTSAEQKNEKALKEFEAVNSRYASRSAGKIALYYTGLCLKNLNRTDEAIKVLEPMSKEKSDYGALALEVLASIYENSGNTAKAVQVYQQMVAHDNNITPKSENMIHLAKLYEQENKPAEAIKIYQQVVKDFPGTPDANDADQKLKQLSR